MNMQTTRKSYTRATLTPEDAMKLIQHIAAYGTEALHLDVHVTRYGTGDKRISGSSDTNMHISVNNGFGITLKVTESITEIDEEENAK